MNKKVKILIGIMVMLVLLILIFRDQIGVLIYEIITPIGPGGMLNNGI